MALLQTPVLISNIDSLLKEYHDTIWSGQGITEDNFQTYSAEKEAEARAKYSTKLGHAIETFVENTIFYVVIGSLPTAGTATSQTNVGPGVINKT